MATDAMLLHGHVSDRDTGTPIAGAAISAGDLRTTTNSRGYFWLRVPAPPEFTTTALAVQNDGFKRHELTNILLLGGADTHFIVRLERGEGVARRDDSHKLWMHRPGGEHPLQDELPQTSGVPFIAVPGMIRVGFNCASATTCTSVEIFSLETYVKRGLNDEWIASWPDDSLRAGAVAYRSYGAYHVAHPRTAAYDICSTTSCQVNDADTSSRTDAAVDATRGVVLVQNGEIFRSEYSAENNNLLGERSCSNADRSCGDGFAGSPNTGWPCLRDEVCSGWSCFGHGRGMCQWGTQRWALQGRDWRWIVRHYYSDGEGLRRSILVEPPRERRRAVGR
jgi:hypothetical protein